MHIDLRPLPGMAMDELYGLLDAIVEAHLHPFKEVMNEDLEQPKKEGNQEK